MIAHASIETRNSERLLPSTCRLLGRTKKNTAVQSADDLLDEAMQTPMLKQLLASMPASMLPMIKEQLKAQLGQGRKKTDATVYDCYVNGWIRKIADSITTTETKSTTQVTTTSECVYHSWK